MIKNERQYEYAKKNLIFLKKELESMKEKYPVNKNKIRFLSQSRIEHITQLEKEIKEYEDMKKITFPTSLNINELHKISQNLARFRIVRGMTQKQLARKIGCKQSDISRLEREGYCGYSINQLYKIINALDLKIEMKLIPKEILIERETLEVDYISSSANEYETKRFKERRENILDPEKENEYLIFLREGNAI